MQELFRKLIHLVFGLLIAGMVWAAGKTNAAAILAGGIFIGLVLVDLILRGHRLWIFSDLIAHFDRNDCLPGKGALMFGVSALACVILFPVSIAVPAIVTLAVLDSVTTIAGQALGRHRIYNGKSFEGTAAGIIVTTIVLLVFMSLPGAVAVAILAGIIELVSPVDDNLVIPVAVAVLLAIMPGVLVAAV